MMMRFTIPLLGLSLLANSSILSAEETSAGFGFGSPEVIKLDWSTRSLTPVDLNADGLLDIAVINNDAGRIEMLYQLPEGEASPEQKKTVNRSRWEPVLEDARFEKRSLTVGFPVFDMALHDLNDDGLVDLAYTSGEVPLTIRYQSEGGEWVNSQEYDDFEALGWTNTIQASDVNGDGSVELFVLSSEAIRVFRPSPDGSLNEPQVFYISGENPFNLMLFDATGDGLTDLLYLCTDGKQVLAMREQLADGYFGPESRFVMERPARIIIPLESAGEMPLSLGVVNSRSGSLEFMRLVTEENKPADAVSALKYGSPEIYPIFNKVRESASYAIGDVNGDGEEDLIVANPAGAELVLFTKTKGRFQASKVFPSFSAVSSLSTGRFFSEPRDSLIVLSETEKTMGLSELDPSGRLTFPRQLKIGQGDPVVTTAVDVNGDGADELVFVEESKGSYSLTVAAPVDREMEEGAWKVLFEMELEGVRRKPIAISALDVYDSGSPGLILFVPREAPVLLRPAGGTDGVAFEAVATQSSIRESLLKAISPAEISTFDVDGDGVNELVVARTGFARAFKVAGDELEMVDQFNARRGSDVINAVIPLQDGSDINSVALYVSEERELQFLQRDETGVFRYDQSVKVGRLDLQNWYHLPSTGELSGGAYLFAGEDRFWYFNSANRPSTWVVEDIYETDLEDIHYSHLVGADFNLDKMPELVALDGSAHVLDILSWGGEEFSSRMFWQVFEQNMHYQGRTGAKLEPRQILVDDFTGDGLPDLTLLVHDRILIYPQE